MSFQTGPGHGVVEGVEDRIPSDVPEPGIAGLVFTPAFYPAVVASLRLRGIEQRFLPGQVISYEGHWPLGVYLHEWGRVDFLVGSTMIGSCAAPCLMGLQSLMGDYVLPFTTRAAEGACVVFVSRAAWKDIVLKHPILGGMSGTKPG